MSGQRYAQATSEESTELVTNRTTVTPLYWNAAIANYEEVPSQSSTNLASNFSNLHLSSHNSHTVSTPVTLHHPHYSTAFPNVESEARVTQNRENSESQQTDSHLR